MVQKNPWMFSTAVLALILTAVLLSTYMVKEKEPVVKEKELTPEEARDKAMNYINENLVQPGTKAAAVSVEEAGSVYKVVTEYQGQLIPVYITREGRYLFLTSPLNISQPIVTPTPEIKAEKLEQFIACLNRSGFKIYGAAWCTYCKQLVEMLGGYEMVKPIYVECTVEKEECAKADIRAYPTIMINGTRYAGERTIEAFSKATNCSPPY